MLIYLAGKYSGDIAENIQRAREVAIELWQKGYAVICPHLNTANFEEDCKCAYDDYIKGDLQIVSRVDAVVLLPGWQDSNGAKLEAVHAKQHGIPVTEYPALPNFPLTESQSPIQCEAFLSTVMKMYRVHLAKNADYSPANILATGEIGLTTRLWDKIARLMNLQGFRIKIESATFEAPRNPKHESIDDTLSDAAVYAVIGQLLRQGKWGK
jgi:hypothetical protein